MAKQNPTTKPTPISTATDSNPMQLEKGTYEIIRQRLQGQGGELKARLSQLNEARRAVFGAVPTQLLSTERITTENNCIPRDMVPIGDRFIFGYNVQFGLKTETHLEDVFAVYSFSDQSFHEQPLDLLGEAPFLNDFKQLYKYYKETRFSKFFVNAPYVYFVFQVGKTTRDIKAFKWLMRNNALEYVDNRSEFEVRLPPQHGFEWKRAGRDLHRTGRHPHISIEDIVFVETIGGDLTIKVEDNTDSGAGIYAEPVDDVDQTLDDAEILYAIVGNVVVLKIRPFKETTFRYIVFNRKTQKALRIDSIEQACLLLPESHGLIFANGYYLQTGEHKVFETNVKQLQFERQIAAANGEDHLYVFYNPSSGEYVLLTYNMIEQHIETPVICHGYSFFDNGNLVFFRDSNEPQKHHALQIWQTPFVSAELNAAVDKNSMLYKIGNRDIVRGMSECHEILNLIGKDDAYADLYLDLVKKTTVVLDTYFWLNDPAVMNLAETLKQIRESAKTAVDEFDKVVAIRANTKQQYETAKLQAVTATNEAARRRFQVIDDFVTALADLRRVRGQLISLRELKYVDLASVNQLEATVEKTAQSLSQRCIEFLTQDDALAPYLTRVQQQQQKIATVKTAVESRQLDDSLAAGAAELELLIEIVSNLKIDDATQRTKIIDNISTIYSSINQTRANLKKRTRELMSLEGAAEFASQLKLLSQAVVNYLDVCDSPERCDEYLTKLMVQVEELEGRFAEFDEFVGQLVEKREEIYAAFDSKKMQIVEGRNRRAATLMNAADRILAGIASRAAKFDSIDEINSYFAADLMVEKVRDIVDQLKKLDESVKVDELQSRIKSIREETVRQLRDRKELFVDGQNIVCFGKHHFSVNVQPLDLTTIKQEGHLAFHLTGTKYFEPINNADLQALQDVWDQELVSENRDVYRAEYLAYLVFQKACAAHAEPNITKLSELNFTELGNHLREFMAPRYREGYIKGVHDHDAALILQGLVKMHSELGLLRYEPSSRALANQFRLSDEFRPLTESFSSRVSLIVQSHQIFGNWSGRSRLLGELKDALGKFRTQHQRFLEADIESAAEFLFEELAANAFHASQSSLDLAQKMYKTLNKKSPGGEFTQAVKATSRISAFDLATDWLQAMLTQNEQSISPGMFVEAANLVAMDMPLEDWQPLTGDAVTLIKGLVGEHPRLQGSPDGYALDYLEFNARLATFVGTSIPRYELFVETKHKLLSERRDELRLEEFKPKVLSSFVRNKLINDVYLPLIGNNLAKQMGSTGEQKRTDLMGLLLLISPPGYGKTTLMEYVASRLGLTFVKINGPAIGHRVTSLDPQEATNASAREEIEKLNLSLEMGDNVMIYVDDIQHCNPEFLQKFISLCDATRRIEGVYHGRPRTYDLRGRKVCVVMAGNPYTESGEKFQIPDMLANRADTYNLGDVVGESGKDFELSYLENSLTSNPQLQRLNAGSRADIQALIEMATNPDSSQVSFEGNFTVEEINEMVSVLRKLMRVREVLLHVNRNYIDSAAQADAYRTEPPFRLQGSYRDMNKLAEKIVPIMNEQELDQLIIDHYLNQAQTLTTGAEANLLKFREIIGKISPEQRTRWEEIKRTFKRNLVLGAAGNDNVAGQLIGQISTLADGLGEIRSAVEQGIQAWREPAPASENQSPMEQLTLVQLGQIVQEFSKFNESLTDLKSALTNSLKETSRGDHEMAPQRIHVVNKVPQAFLDIIRYQFETLERWLDPINKLAASMPPAKRLSKTAKKVADNYKNIVKELEARAENETEDL